MKKQKSHSPELISRPLVTRASQENDAAKIQKILEHTKEKLNTLAESYKQVKEPKGFITDLKLALGMDPKNASGYAVFEIGGNQMRVSIRVSNHHANAGKYLQHDPNDFNLSIMVSKRYRKNTFQANPDVILEEYVLLHPPRQIPPKIHLLHPMHARLRLSSFFTILQFLFQKPQLLYRKMPFLYI